MSVIKGLVGAILCVVACLATQADARRLALVVGVDNYDNITDLQKAANDAYAVEAALSEVGFRVTRHTDVSRRDFFIALNTFYNQVEVGDEVVFYFAGHGVEVEGRNYLLPRDVPVVQPGNETLLKSESVAADSVLENIQRRGARMTFLILDACRNNPFPRSGQRSVGAQQGLARMDPPEGAFVLYSAGTGQTALDRLSNADPNPNSVFTRALLPLIREPGVSLPELTRRVRSDVRQLARSVNHDQFPAYYDQMAGQFFFQPPTNGRGTFSLGTGSAPAALATPAPAANPCDAAGPTWDIIKNSQSRAVFEQFEQQFAQCGLFAALARERIASFAAASQPVVPPVTVLPQPQPQQPQQQPAAAPLPKTGDICFDLWYERNAIFHGYGYCFQTAKAKQHFDTRTCTTRSPNLSALDMRRVEGLRSQERAAGC